MGRLFGTDGIRGIANIELTAELALGVGRAAAAVVHASGRGEGGAPRPAFLIGRDTRASGEMLEAALASGFLSAGADVVHAGVMPTPAVAHLVVDLGLDAGVVISASHNPAGDNGIKFFGRDGFKLNDSEEDLIEKALLAGPGAQPPAVLGRATELAGPEKRYVDHALEALEGGSLAGLRVVADCAHGAAYRTTPMALAAAGAEVRAINIDPDGTNINMGGGSTSPEVLAQAVVAAGADAGLAHDGDADRVIAVDELGGIVDGDCMLAALAIDLKEQGRLAGDLAVGTVMANLGFRLALADAGIKLVETAVGDRYVIEAMRQLGAVAGGEQSGHLIFLEHSTTGDGLITGLRLLGLMARTGKRLSELAGVVKRFPQVLLNVPVAEREGLSEADAVWEAVEAAEAALSGTGRVLVRASGTERVVRVMVEAADQSLAASTAEGIAEVIRKQLGGA